MHIARCVLSCADICFISASIALGRRFNAASKKENNTEETNIHMFYIHLHSFSNRKRPLKNDPFTLDLYNIDKLSQALVSYY